MTDVNTLVAQVRSIAETLTSPTSPPLSIKQAEHQLLQIKESLPPAQLLQLCQTLLSPLFTSTLNPVDLTSYLFSFQILRDQLLRSTTAWTSFPSEIRGGVREIAVRLFNHISAVDATGNPIQSFPSQIRSAIVALMTALALREWPQEWPEFLDQLLADLTRAETVAAVLCDLSDDINKYHEQIDPVRLQELRRVMALTLPQTLRYITAAADAFLKQAQYERLDIVMQTLESFLPWAALHSVFAANVPQACFQLLQNKRTRMAALRVLGELVQRNFTEPGSKVDEGQTSVEPERAFRAVVFDGLADFVQQSSLQIVAWFSLVPPTDALSAFKEAYAATNVRIDADGSRFEAGKMVYDDEEHEFCIAFFEMAASLGTKNFISAYLHTKRKGKLTLTAEDELRARRYLEIMIAGTASPSLAIRLKVLPFFTSVLGAMYKLREILCPLQGIAQFLVVGYLHAGCMSVIRFPDDPVYALMREMDEGADAEDDLPETFLPRTISCIANSAKLYPDFAGICGLMRFKHLLAQYPGNGDGKKPLGTKKWAKELGYIVSDGSQHGWSFGSFSQETRTSWLLCVSATITAAEAIVTGSIASEIAFETKPTLELMRAVFEMVTGISEPDLLPLKAQALRIFLPLYALPDPTFLRNCFEILVSQGVNVNVTSDARFKACLAVSAICRRLSTKQFSFESLASFRENMCVYTVQAFSNRSFESTNKLLLLEASIATILGGSDLAVQTTFIDRLFAPFLGQLQSSEVQKSFQSPEKLIMFVSEEQNKTAHVYEAFQAVEAGAHQIVRPISKATSPAVINCALSQATAGHCVATTLSLIQSLHGLYNPTKFPLDGPKGIRQSILHPTSKEVASFLNLDSQIGHWRQEHVHELSQQGGNQGLGSATEQKNIEVLLKHGIKPPNPEHNQKRERLKSLRRSSYEIIRSAIYAGVIRSPNEMDALLHAITTDYQYMEPMHLIEVASKIIRPLLCFQLSQLHMSHIERLANSPIPRVLEVIRTHVEHVKPGGLIEGDDPLLSITRDHGRMALAKAAIDVITGMFPRVQGKENVREGEMTDNESFIPHVFTQSNALSNELMLLWVTVCNVWVSVRSSKDAQAAFAAITTAVDMAPASGFGVFEALLKTSLDTAVQNSGIENDSPLQSAIGAMASILRKWPTESEDNLRKLVARNNDDANKWITDCIVQVTASNESKSRGKKQRGFIKVLVKKIADYHGLSNERKNTVKALPKKLVTKNPARKQRNELEEVVLTESALDSLYHDGDPL